MLEASDHESGLDRLSEPDLVSDQDTIETRTTEYMLNQRRLMGQRLDGSRIQEPIAIFDKEPQTLEPGGGAVLAS